MIEKPEETPVDEDLLEGEEEAAAAEAARIGGRSGMEDKDPAERAAAEHGGGESEGFEEADELLRDQAEVVGDDEADELDAPEPDGDVD
jgi:hypothetical protein